MHKKYTVGLILIAIYAMVLFAVPSLIFDKSVTPILASITLIMVAVYVLLGLEIIHRTVLATFAAIASKHNQTSSNNSSSSSTMDFSLIPSKNGSKSTGSPMDMSKMLMPPPTQ